MFLIPCVLVSRSHSQERFSASEMVGHEFCRLASSTQDLAAFINDYMAQHILNRNDEFEDYDY